MTLLETDCHDILGVELDTDQLVDIVNHGMAQGVSGFIYRNECKLRFDHYEKEIMELCNRWCDDLFNKSAINYVTSINPYDDIQSLTNDLVWLYVEIKADQILTAMEHPAVN